MGFDAQSYRERNQGYSPEDIRDQVWAQVKDQVTGTILDAGSGSGGWIKRVRLIPGVKKIISVDITDQGASRIPGVEFHLGDLSHGALPCSPGTLDWIFAIEVIEHLANPRHFFSEAGRGLKPGGRLVVTTPCNDSLRAKLSFLTRGFFPAFCDSDYQGSGHITPIFELDLRRMAREAGFDRVELFYPLPGLIPRLPLKWQSFAPFLRGKLWTDTLFAVCSK